MVLPFMEINKREQGIEFKTIFINLFVCFALLTGVS
jgi:hypothetical protein